MVHSGEQEKESIIRVRVGIEPVCHYLASLVMPISDPQEGFFYPTFTLMMDSYILCWSDRDRSGNFCIRKNQKSQWISQLCYNCFAVF